MGELDGKVAVVTGGGKGIGKGIALRFAKEGANLVIPDLDVDAAEEVAKEARAIGRKAIAIKANCSESAEVNRVVKEIVNKFKKIDILVNTVGGAAGIFLTFDLKDRFSSDVMRILNTPEDLWDLTIKNNLKSCFLWSKAVGNQMVKQGTGGNIINFSSQAGKAIHGDGAYSAAKAGVIMLTRGLAQELAPHKVRVNCICPGIIDTPALEFGYRKRAEALGQKFDWEKTKKEAGKSQLLGYMGSVEDVANIAFFLVSSQSSYMTGQALNATGGTVTI